MKYLIQIVINHKLTNVLQEKNELNINDINFNTRTGESELMDRLADELTGDDLKFNKYFSTT